MDPDDHPHDLLREQRRRTKFGYCLIAIALWVLALFLPAYSDGTPGVACALFGWTMLFDGHTFAFIAWLGNIFSLVALIMLIFARRKYVLKYAVWISTGALIMSLGAFASLQLPAGVASQPEPVSVSSGAFVWMASEIMVLLGAAMSMQKGTEH